MRKNHLIFLGILIFIISGLGACSDKETTEEEKVFNPEPNPDAAQISTYNEDRMEKQVEMDSDVLAEYEEEDYNINDPFAKLDPYGTSPLSALIMFETKEAVEVQVTSGTEKYEEPVTNKWENGETTHAIPVLELLSWSR